MSNICADVTRITSLLNEIFSEWHAADVQLHVNLQVAVLSLEMWVLGKHSMYNPSISVPVVMSIEGSKL